MGVHPTQLISSGISKQNRKSGNDKGMAKEGLHNAKTQSKIIQRNSRNAIMVSKHNTIPDLFHIPSSNSDPTLQSALCHHPQANYLQFIIFCHIDHNNTQSLSMLYSWFLILRFPTRHFQNNFLGWFYSNNWNLFCKNDYQRFPGKLDFSFPSNNDIHLYKDTH